MLAPYSMRIERLSFTIAGSTKAVKLKAQQWMLAMSSIMGIEVDDITLVETERECRGNNLKKFKAGQIDDIFKTKKPFKP